MSEFFYGLVFGFSAGALAMLGFLFLIGADQ